MKFNYERKVRGCKFNVGDWIWMKNTVKGKVMSKKLNIKWKGSYTIMQIIGEVNFLIKLDKGRKVLVVHRNLFKSYYSLSHVEKEKPGATTETTRDLCKFMFEEENSTIKSNDHSQREMASTTND